MSKKTKKKAKTKAEDEQDERPDDGTEVYDESEDEEDEKEWVDENEDRRRAAKKDMEAQQAEGPEEHVGSTEEETRDMQNPETTTEAPVDPKDQPQVDQHYDIVGTEPHEPAPPPDQQEKYKEPPAPIPGDEPADKDLGDRATKPTQQQLLPGEKGKRKEED